MENLEKHKTLSSSFVVIGFVTAKKACWNIFIINTFVNCVIWFLIKFCSQQILLFSENQWINQMPTKELPPHFLKPSKFYPDSTSGFWRTRLIIVHENKILIQFRKKQFSHKKKTLKDEGCSSQSKKDGFCFWSINKSK